MTTLFHVPLEVAQAVAALLEREELSALARTCRTAAASAAFHSPPRATTLILPPTDYGRAERLVSTLDSRLARFEWIEIACTQHVGMLLAPVVRDTVSSVRVKRIAGVDLRPETMGVRLAALSHLTKLDLSNTSVVDVAWIVELPQLRFLSLSRTDVADTTPLGSLVHLEELELMKTCVTRMHCLRTMPELRRLEIKHKDRDRIDMTSLRAPNRLHTLRAWTTLVDLDTFADAIAHLQHLTLCEVYIRTGNAYLYLAVDRFIRGLTQLESLHDRDNLVVPVDVLSSLPNLRTMSNAPLGAYEDLVVLTQLEYMGLDITSYYTSEDYRFLLRMPRLKSICIRCDDAGHDAEMERLLTVLGEFPQLDRLYIETVIDCDDVEPELRHLSHLQHLTIAAGEYTENLNWLEPYQLLRSLTIEIGSSDTDIAAIGALTQLQYLCLTIKSTAEDDHHDVDFLANLVHLEALILSGKLRDLAFLSRLTKLRELAIISSSDEPMQHYEVLGCLTFLRELDISMTSITDLRPLLLLSYLRTVTIAKKTDCCVLAECDHPSLLRVLHPTHNCLWVQGLDGGCPLGLNP